MIKTLRLLNAGVYAIKYFSDGGPAFTINIHQYFTFIKCLIQWFRQYVLIVYTRCINNNVPLRATFEIYIYTAVRIYFTVFFVHSGKYYKYNIIFLHLLNLWPLSEFVLCIINMLSELKYWIFPRKLTL